MAEDDGQDRTVEMGKDADAHLVGTACEDPYCRAVRPDSAHSDQLAAAYAHVVRTLEFSVLHGTAVLVTWLLVQPTQDAILHTHFGVLAQTPLLIFLPGLIKALAAWMYGWWSLLYIFPTALVQHLWLGLPLDLSHLSLLVVYVSAAPTVITLAGALGWNAREARHYRAWWAILGVVLCSALVMSAAVSLQNSATWDRFQVIWFVAGFVVGDLVGAFVGLLSFLIVFRLRPS